MKSVSFFHHATLPLLAVLTLLLATSAHAERTVGNGGGLGEMQAIFLQHNLASFLTPCVATPSTCEITSDVLPEVLAAIALARNSLPRDFIIDRTVQAQDVFSADRSLNTPIRMSPWALYLASGDDLIPRSIPEIAGLVLASFWSKVSDRDKFDLIERAKKITHGFSDDSVQFAVSKSPDIIIHQQSVQFAGANKNIIVLQDLTQAIDLTEKIAPQLSCRDGQDESSDFRMENWRTISLTESSATVLSDIVSICKAEKNYEVMVLRFKINPQRQIEPSTIVVEVRPSM